MAGAAISLLVVVWLARAAGKRIRDRQQNATARTWGHISDWDVTAVTNMSGLFRDFRSFSDDLSSWNTSLVRDMSHMFANARAFNSPLNSWNTSSVRDMSCQFCGASSFNRPLQRWITSSVKRMNDMFAFARLFNQNIDSWDTSSVLDMSGMFSYASSFNQSINSWDTSAVKDMSNMFSHAAAFNQPLHRWNTTSVRDMSYMFKMAKAFQRRIGTWDTSAVEDMHGMFQYAVSFNQPLSQWDTASVKDMINMFYRAKAFNQSRGPAGAALGNSPLALQGAADLAVCMEGRCLPITAGFLELGTAEWTGTKTGQVSLGFGPCAKLCQANESCSGFLLRGDDCGFLQQLQSPRRLREEGPGDIGGYQRGRCRCLLEGDLRNVPVLSESLGCKYQYCFEAATVQPPTWSRHQLLLALVIRSKSSFMTLVLAAYTSLRSVSRHRQKRSQADAAQVEAIIARLDADLWEESPGMADRYAAMLQAGVPMYLLSEHFAELARDRTAERDPTFHRMKEAFWLKDAPIGADIQCPRDGRPGCALVDWLPPSERRAQTHYLSWTWVYSLYEVRSSLDTFAGSIRESHQVFLYMCFFVNNHFRTLVDGDISGSQDPEQAVKPNLTQARSMLAVLSSWHTPVYFTRLWTIYEQTAAFSMGVPVTFVMTPSAMDSLQRYILTDRSSWEDVQACVGKIDSAGARANDPEDEKRLRSALQEEGGFDSVNAQLSNSFLAWLEKTGQEMLRHENATELVLPDDICITVHEDFVSVCGEFFAQELFGTEHFERPKQFAAALRSWRPIHVYILEPHHGLPCG
ncbi:hypothetical protein AK812_SmicGene19726 [Symbiodinium microadriaticum]|uniref:Uncharacterized protein n=1 Tax=Symbiodinium microadriaticum TaxID=2951 RepID=A0A1Q9DRR9_SYMMI|nr:hypothetical protein AK812_SmicGene19726 [Symbiodinium microadriaticum]